MAGKPPSQSPGAPRTKQVTPVALPKRVIASRGCQRPTMSQSRKPLTASGVSTRKDPRITKTFINRDGQAPRRPEAPSA